MRSLFGNLHTPSTFSALSGRPPGRAVRGSGLLWFLLCAVAGGLQAASLAWPLQAWVPPGLAPGEPSGAMQIASLALLVWALRHVHRVRQAAWRAWVFATAWLTGTFWWLFISMHTYGGLPATLGAERAGNVAQALAGDGDRDDRVEALFAGPLDAGQTMAEIVTQVRRVNDLISEVSAASREINRPDSAAENCGSLLRASS